MLLDLLPSACCVSPTPITNRLLLESRVYPQFPFSRDRHPIPHRLSPFHTPVIILFSFFTFSSLYDYRIEAMSLLCIQDSSCDSKAHSLYPRQPMFLSHVEKDW